MKKILIPIMFALIVCMKPLDLSAKTICFAGGDSAAGSYFYFSGGKVDLKPFSGYRLAPFGFCKVPASASIMKDPSGYHHISINIAHDAATTCIGIMYIASGATTASMSGESDFYQDGSFENTFTLTEINCNSIPN